MNARSLVIEAEVVTPRMYIECSIVHEAPIPHTPLLEKNGNELLSSEGNTLNCKIK